MKRDDFQRNATSPKTLYRALQRALPTALPVTSCRATLIWTLASIAILGLVRDTAPAGQVVNLALSAIVGSSHAQTVAEDAAGNPNHVITKNRMPPAISVNQAQSYLIHAQRKIDQDKLVDAQYVLKFLISARGVPELVRQRATLLLNDVDEQASQIAANDEDAAVSEIPATAAVVTDSVSAADTPAPDAAGADSQRASRPAVRPSRLGILNNVGANAAPAGYDNPDDALIEIEKRLNGFKSNTGRYPLGYRELNELLPAGQPPLGKVDIIYYVSRYGGFIVTVRDKDDPSTEVTIQRTGLIQ